MKITFAQILRQWRKQRRYSQLQLACELDISSKHISFLETGRSLPSKQMIVRIGLFLIVPKNEINRALLTVGFAPMYTELASSHNDLQPVFNAINQMLSNHMPYPAIVLNKNWDLINVNVSAEKLLTQMGYSNHNNLIEALIADDAKTSKIINWHKTVAQLLLRLKNEICLIPESSYLQELVGKLSTKVSNQDELLAIDNIKPVLTTQIKINNIELSFFSIIANLGMVQDVAVSEFKIELMFPADDKTKEYYGVRKTEPK